MPERTSHAMSLRALVVEDDIVTREFLVEALAQSGWTVGSAATLSAALAHIREWTPRLVLCDVRLPDGDAFAVAGELAPAAGAGSRACYAIALSAEMDPVLRDRLIGAGYDEVLPKPLAIDRLITSLSRARQALSFACGDLLPRGACEDPSVDPADEFAGAAILDDAAAIEACGNAGTVEALRRLLAAELPGCLERLGAAQAEGDRGARKEILHRLRSSSGFCGACALGLAVSAACRDEPEDSRGDPALARVLREGHALLGQLAVRRAQQELAGT